MASLNTNELTPQRLTMDDQLAIGVEEVVEQAKITFQRRRVRENLAASGLYLARDMLVMGKAAVRDIRGVGPSVMGAFEGYFETVQNVHPLAIWRDAPEMPDIVLLCSSLDKVTGAKLGDPFRNHSVQNILDMKELAIARLMSTKYEPATTGEVKIAMARAAEFGDKFETTRQAMIGRLNPK